MKKLMDDINLKYNAKEAYRDLDGNMKQFTHVDHDPKLKVDTVVTTEEELKDMREFDEAYYKAKYAALLALPAISSVLGGDGVYEAYVIRDITKGVIWNEEKLAEHSTDYLFLYNLFNRCWRNTVKEQFWYSQIPYEELIWGVPHAIL